MATVLAYTSPALGHLLPMAALLAELAARGHRVHLRTLAGEVEHAAAQGFSAAPIDARIEAITMDDWRASNPVAALRLSVSAFSRRAPYEVDDLRAAIAAVRPDGLLVDVNCWGAQTAAEAAGLPWATFSPYTPTLDVEGVPPFGLGLRPKAGILGRWRDALVRAAVNRPLQRPAVAAITELRDRLGLSPVASLDAFLRRTPMLFLTTGTPFQYAGDWGENVHMIGPCIPPRATGDPPSWLTAIDRPIVLVTTSSEQQNDAGLVSAAVAALADDPVHVVATLPAGAPDGVTDRPHVTIRRYVDHDLVLARAVCAVTHGGMGGTQRALARGVPVCVVPFGRDQFEVARRAEVAGCGTRLPARRLSVPRLREAIHEAMTMQQGAARVAEGFRATGGVGRGADLFEQLMRR
ncbi:glycosyltransferase [Mycolicibacterium rufum]|uniref:Glycosyltransferase n=1 Tax=Mycolicibacterium rufum TaxID=318424 RepID=A0A9X2Y983_9MYCO|nr:glycosyltransferase [Mycolicibacterium rufum]KGI67503.1 glycosyl transferase [Mycolicibacterium rufum]MCV7069184.1 glycosyltransferase family 1 protein [Mycolicibacterium rufum]ULP38460.1 glycosyltransferase [Mycolicibacterium rufum]